MDSELYLALISWTGGWSETRLTVHGIDRWFPVRGLRIGVPDAGRMLHWAIHTVPALDLPL